jgi:DNA topoisomerase-2
MIRITELPLGMWTNTYKELLESLMENKNKKKQPIIKSYKDMCTDTLVDFEIKFYSGTINKLISVSIDDNTNVLEKTLKLFTTKSLTNMWLFDHEQKLEKYNSVHDIIDRYYPIRYNAYIKRKEYLIKLLEKEACILKNKARFILEQCDNTFDLRRKKKCEVIQIIIERNFDAIDGDGEYKYLRKMTLEQVEEENMLKLVKDRDIKMTELEDLKLKTPEIMWLEELGDLKNAYNGYKKERKLRKSDNIKNKKSTKNTKSTKSTKNTKNTKNTLSYTDGEEKN